VLESGLDMVDGERLQRLTGRGEGPRRSAAALVCRRADPAGPVQSRVELVRQMTASPRLDGEQVAGAA